jgi:hypothetical protein
MADNQHKAEPVKAPTEWAAAAEKRAVVAAQQSTADINVDKDDVSGGTWGQGSAGSQHVDNAEARLKLPWHKDLSAVDSHGHLPSDSPTASPGPSLALPLPSQSADDSWEDSLSSGCGWPKGKGMASMADNHRWHDWSLAHDRQSNTDAASAAAATNDNEVDQQPATCPEAIFQFLVNDYGVDLAAKHVLGCAQTYNAGVGELVNVCGGRVHMGQSGR